MVNKDIQSKLYNPRIEENMWPNAALPPWRRCRRLANPRWTTTGFRCSGDAYIRCFPAAVRSPWARFRGRHKSCQHCWTPDCCRGRDGATASDDARDLDSPSAPPLSSSSLSAADLTHKLHIDSPPPQRFLTLTRHIARDFAVSGQQLHLHTSAEQRTPSKLAVHIHVNLCNCPRNWLVRFFLLLVQLNFLFCFFFLLFVVLLFF